MLFRYQTKRFGTTYYPLERVYDTIQTDAIYVS